MIIVDFDSSDFDWLILQLVFLLFVSFWALTSIDFEMIMQLVFWCKILLAFSTDYFNYINMISKRVFVDFWMFRLIIIVVVTVINFLKFEILILIWVFLIIEFINWFVRFLWFFCLFMMYRDIFVCLLIRDILLLIFLRILIMADLIVTILNSFSIINVFLIILILIENCSFSSNH